MMRIDPGDIIKLDVKVEAQIGPVNLSGGSVFQQRDAFRIGNTNQGFVMTRNLEEIIDSDGWSLDGYAGLTVNISNKFDLIGRVLMPLVGEDLQFFPIEDLHPTHGNVYTGAFAFRF
jgi:hypothetical protein